MRDQASRDKVTVDIASSLALFVVLVALGSGALWFAAQATDLDDVTVRNVVMRIATAAAGALYLRRSSPRRPIDAHICRLRGQRPHAESHMRNDTPYSPAAAARRLAPAKLRRYDRPLVAASPGCSRPNHRPARPPCSHATTYGAAGRCSRRSLPIAG